MPEAAGIGRGQALSGVTGGKGGVDGDASLEGKAGAQPPDCFGSCMAGVQEREVEFLV